MVLMELPEVRISHWKMIRAPHLRIRMSAFIAIFLCVSGCTQETPDGSHANRNGSLLFQETGAYTGAYIDFGDTEDAVTIDALEDFEKLIGKHQTIVASSSFWGEQSFPMKNVKIISAYGAVPLIYWLPWDRPYKEDRGPDRFSLTSILSGDWDAYIDAWADQARVYGRPLLVSWGLEMNGYWFPWSGYFYGNGEDAPQGSLKEHPGPGLYKEAFRHVVDRVKSRGVSNILWGFHANSASYPDERWNTMASYYPGPAYVDWLGLSVYGKQVPDEEWFSFHEVMDPAYRAISALDDSKPIIVAEWGVGEFPRSGDKAQWIREAFEAMRLEYPRVKAAVYWHERWRNDNGTYSNLHVHSSPEALDAYRACVKYPYWKDRL